MQAEKDALRAKRNQEQFERDWRKKQKETIEKKADNDRLLKEARQQQINDKEHFLSLQAQRDRSEFSRVLQVQQELQQKDQELSKEHAVKNKAYSEQVSHLSNYILKYSRTSLIRTQRDRKLILTNRNSYYRVCNNAVLLYIIS